VKTLIKYGHRRFFRDSASTGSRPIIALPVCEAFADGRGDAARFHQPEAVELAANDEIVVADTDNHAIRVVMTGVAVRTLAGNGEEGEGKGADARLSYQSGVAQDKDGNILVTDVGNNAVRRVTMAGVASTVLHFDRAPPCPPPRLRAN
jgi:hypothetical protein